MAGDTLRLRVTAVRPEAQGIVGLSLASLDGSPCDAANASKHETGAVPRDCDFHRSVQSMNARGMA